MYQTPVKMVGNVLASQGPVASSVSAGKAMRARSVRLVSIRHVRGKEK